MDWKRNRSEVYLPLSENCVCKSRLILDENNNNRWQTEPGYPINETNNYVSLIIEYVCDKFT